MLGVPGRMASVQSQGFCGITLRSSSADLFETTSSVPPRLRRTLIGCRPYQAQDSIPSHIVSSRTVITSRAPGSYLAMCSWSVSVSRAIPANCLAGLPLRSGEPLYRWIVDPSQSRSRAARTTCLHRAAASVFWKIPRYVNSTLFASSLTSVDVRPSVESCSLGTESPASLPVGIPSPSLSDPPQEPSLKPPASVARDSGLTTLPVAAHGISGEWSGQSHLAWIVAFFLCSRGKHEVCLWRGFRLFCGGVQPVAP